MTKKHQSVVVQIEAVLSSSKSASAIVALAKKDIGAALEKLIGVPFKKRPKLPKKDAARLLRPIFAVLAEASKLTEDDVRTKYSRKLAGLLLPLVAIQPDYDTLDSKPGRNPCQDFQDSVDSLRQQCIDAWDTWYECATGGGSGGNGGETDQFSFDTGIDAIGSSQSPGGGSDPGTSTADPCLDLWNNISQLGEEWNLAVARLQACRERNG